RHQKIAEEGAVLDQQNLALGFHAERLVRLKLEPGCIALAQIEDRVDEDRGAARNDRAAKTAGLAAADELKIERSLDDIDYFVHHKAEHALAFGKNEDRVPALPPRRLSVDTDQRHEAAAVLKHGALARLLGFAEVGFLQTRDKRERNRLVAVAARLEDEHGNSLMPGILVAMRILVRLAF